jgi:predicted transcriptional regulator
MSAPLRRDLLHLASEMLTRLDELAREVGRALAREVSRAAVVRAAVTAWLDVAESRPPDFMGQAIRAATKRPAEPLLRYPQRWPAALRDRLDQFARSSTRALACKVSRSAVVRVAIAVWLDAAGASPAVATEAIRAALVSRGRKR